jgi:hypothetical protein
VEPNPNLCVPNPDKPEIPMTKSQFPNPKQIPMFKIPNLQVWVIGNLVIGYYLELGAWNL